MRPMRGVGLYELLVLVGGAGGTTCTTSTSTSSTTPDSYDEILGMPYASWVPMHTMVPPRYTLEQSTISEIGGDHGKEQLGDLFAT
eukprot:683750-Rhodomonas_salina.2